MVKKGSYPRSPPPQPLPPLWRALDRAPGRVVGRARAQAAQHVRVLVNQHLGELHDDDGQPFGAVALTPTSR
jgi:hypothetical protein